MEFGLNQIERTLLSQPAVSKHGKESADPLFTHLPHAFVIHRVTSPEERMSHSKDILLCSLCFSMTTSTPIYSLLERADLFSSTDNSREQSVTVCFTFGVF